MIKLCFKTIFINNLLLFIVDLIFYKLLAYQSIMGIFKENKDGPNWFEKPKYDPLLGFKNGRKVRSTIVCFICDFLKLYFLWLL